MSKLNLSDVINFTKLLNKFQEVERVVYHTESKKLENDAEHSYQLAMLAWYIAETNSLNLDKNLLLKYALIHDLVEVYAGDTFLYSKNQNDHDSKQEREKLAQQRILEEFPEFNNLHEIISEYEKRENKESKFIYVLDKIHPVVQIYLDNGRNWKENDVTLTMLLEKKKDKAMLSPELLPLWNELEKILIENEHNLFSKN